MRNRLTILLVALAMAAAACAGERGSDTAAGGGEDGGATGDGETGGGDADADGGETGDGDCADGDTDGDLVLYNWSDYIDPELLEAFSQEHGVSVTEDFYPSNEEMLAKVQGGASGYDIVVPSDYMVGIMIGEGLLAELDRDALPNADNVDEEFSDPPFDPGSVYSMPYQWGTTGLGVDLEVVGEDAPHSWALLFDPEVTADYQGRMSMLDDPREAMAAALAYLGHDINTTSEDELGEAADLIAETSDRLAAFDSNLYGDLLMSGETAVAHGYSGTFFAAFDEADDPDRYTYVIPEEGGVKWVDTIAILADAPHPCTAHTFINFILDAENGAALTNWTYYASPNAAAEEFIVEDILEDPAIYPPEEVLAELEFLRDTGDAEILYNDLFTRAKS